MTIIIDANITTNCKHKQCALTVLIMILLDQIKTDFHPEADLPKVLEIDDANNNIKVEFIY